MDVCKFNEQKEIDSNLNMFKENSQQHYNNIDQQFLEKYNHYNKHFSIINIHFNEDQQLKQIINYVCIYRYENHLIKLEHYLSNGIWKIIPEELNLEEQQKLNILLDDLNITRDLSLDQQIEIIIKRFNHHFYELNQTEKIEQNENKISILKEDDDDEIKNLNDRSNKLSLSNNISTPSTILEDDEQQTDLPIQSLFIDSHQKPNNLKPSVTSHRIRHDSSCSSASSIKYTQFVPPSMTSVCRRRVIQSILLRVQRKKKVLEKIHDTLKHTPPEPTMYELGLEFLRIYDGKFNYPKGHTFIMSFEKRTWFLTIDNIKCIECQLGESEPRSVLIIKYKNRFTTVQV